MGPRRIARELALQFLFSCDMLGRLNMTEAEAAAAFDAFGRHFAVGMPGSRAALPYARTLASGVCQRLAELDAQIAARSHNWLSISGLGFFGFGVQPPAAEIGANRITSSRFLTALSS